MKIAKTKQLTASNRIVKMDQLTAGNKIGKMEQLTGGNKIGKTDQLTAGYNILNVNQLIAGNKIGKTNQSTAGNKIGKTDQLTAGNKIGKMNQLTVGSKIRKMNQLIAGNKRLLAVLLLVMSVISCCHADQSDLGEDPESYFSRLAADLWLEGADVIRVIWRDCSKKLVDVKDVIDHKEYFPKFLRCMKRKTLRALDRTLSPDVVPIADGVNLVRFELVDMTGKVMQENDTNGSWSDKELDEGEWRMLALQRLGRVLRTHVIKFDFDHKNNLLEQAEYRGRRRYHMMTMMMFGIVSIGMVLIPMGFQFLAVLGGKAILLAKMALILASIQGLKKVHDRYDFDGFYDRSPSIPGERPLDRGKIATNPLNYGFYQSYPYDHYDKRSIDTWISTMTTPPTTLNPWSNIETGDIKVDRIHMGDINNDVKVKRSIEELKPEPRSMGNERLYPVYTGYPQFQSPVYSSIDAPAPLVDLTTNPGEVQADLSIDMPYNGFRFQTPTPIFPA